MSEANGTIPNQRKTCAGTRRDGQPCSSFALPESPFCFAHDPERKAERLEAQRRGGQNKAAVVRLRGLVPPRLLPVFDQLELAMREVHDGAITPGQGQAMASIARAMAQVLTAGEVEQRLRDLEAAIGKDQQKWPA